MHPLLKHTEYFKHLVNSGGPKKSDYEDLTAFYNEVWAYAKQGVYTSKEIRELNGLMTEAGLEGTMQGRSFLKKYGYAGDFEIIDNIYLGTLSPLSQFVNWDIYYHAQESARAVCNRKTLFKETLAGLKKRDAAVLDFASGPCRDLYEFYRESATPPRLKVECVESEPKAIAYAENLLSSVVGDISFTKKNVLRFQPNKNYDLIWSGGLFDYFSDKMFVWLLQRMKTWLADGGQIVIGNFAAGNPTQAYMEFVEWSIHHRTETSMRDLAAAAGFDSKKIEVLQEAAGVNYFLYLEG